MLWSKQIPFTDLEPSLAQLEKDVEPNVGRISMPVVKLEQAAEEHCGKDTSKPSPFAKREKRSHSLWWRQDSAATCDDIEAAHPEVSTTPKGACQRLAASLLELHGDCWLPMLSLHQRFNEPASAAWAQGELRRCAFPDHSPELWELLGPVQLAMDPSEQLVMREQGVTPATAPGLDDFTADLTAQLEAHLAKHDFLLGGAPCRGDFSLYGQLWAGVYRDPHARHVFDAAPHVVRWFERLHGHEADPAFPSDTARTASTDANAPSAGQFLPADEVPTTLEPIFRTMFAEQWPYLAAASRAIDADVAAQHASERRVPRVLDYVPFQVGGADGERLVETYQVWRLQRTLFEYAALASAPNRSLELRAVDAWLERVGVREAFCAVNPVVRLDRSNRLPQKASQGVFSAELAPGGIVFRF